MLSWITQNKTVKKIVVLQLLFLVAFFVFLPLGSVVKAQAPEVFSEDFGLQPIEDTLSLGKQDIRITIAKIIRVVLSFLGIVALVLVLYAGFTIMTAGGNADRVETGKKILINAGIGLLIIMASFAITQFVLNKLGQATGYAGGPGGGGPAGTPSYTASGSLGTIVKDHYPFRNQIDVARNTRITVTFFMPLDPTSLFIENGGGSELGDCGAPFVSWWDSCDRLDTTAVEVWELDDEGNKVAKVIEINALAVYEGESVYTIVLRPKDFLGDSVRDISYSVNLTSDILKEGGAYSMFEEDSDGRYEWRFRTGTEIDLSPPWVVSVYPRDGLTAPRNTIIQINFNEAVDPTVVQGSADTFTNIIFDHNVDADVQGYWKVSSGYKTVEFVSYEPCGQNSCGDEMYCIPTSCPTGDEACFDARLVLVRTADQIIPGSFEGAPFSGVMDMAGNALDGDNDGLPVGKPPIGTENLIDPGEENPDNYIWGFNIQNIIDRTAPYIISVIPNPDDENVPSGAPFEILFSKPMWSATLGNIGVEEHPYYKPFWFSAFSTLTPSDQTRVKFSHRAFGPDEKDLYYFTSVGSQVKSVNQNCVYPGRGPTVTGADCVEDADGNIIGSSCVATTFDSNEDTACVFTGAGAGLLQPTVQDCLGRIDDPDVSPPPI